jgi:hypothetical protein
MTTDELIAAWRAWLRDNPDQPVGILLDRLSRIAIEQRRPSAQRQTRPVFKRRR